MSCKYSCKICLKLFKSNYHLQRHMNRKRPCLKNNFEISNLDNYPKLSKVIQNYPKLSKNIPSIIQNDIINSIDNKNTIKTTYKCKYCCRTFARIDSLLLSAWDVYVIRLVDQDRGSSDDFRCRSCAVGELFGGNI